MLSPTLFLTLSAVLPIALLLTLLLACSWTAVRASLASFALAVVVALSFYQASPEHVGDEILKGVWNSISIIIVIFPAILIYEISRSAGAFPAIRQGITTLIPDHLLQVLTLGWCFSSFLQGPSGFGVPIAVTAPLLIAIGVKPLWAVAIPLLGHGWANTFGTLALAWDAMVQQIPLPAETWLVAALWTGFFLFLMNLLAGFTLCWFYQGLAGVRHGFPAVLILGLTMGGGQMALAAFLPSLATVIPTTLALGLALLLARLKRYRQASSSISPLLVANSQQPAAPASGGLVLHQALLPYYALTVISLLVLLTPPLKNALGRFSTSFIFTEHTTKLGFVSPGSDNYSPLAWLIHSGFFLFLSAAVAGFYYYRQQALPSAKILPALRDTWRKALPASLSVLFLIGMSKVMGGTGQTDVLAQAAAALTGNAYGALAPLIGVLGAFMSSSNVSSNILFSQFQFVTARLTGFDVAVVLAAQTCGGALGCMISPAKVMLGATTAGVAGQEGVIIRKLLGVSVLSAALLGVLVLVFG
ncbi:MAG: L-lactate permease [Planctomycetota bacterium]|jgi:lactate permease|nr:L-lactate permease [Planctomycetota bacterium]